MFEGKLVAMTRHSTRRRPRTTTQLVTVVPRRRGACRRAILPALHKVADNLARTPPIRLEQRNKFASRVDDATVRSSRFRRVARHEGG
jgi:hypothetical protein